MNRIVHLSSLAALTLAAPPAAVSAAPASHPTPGELETLAAHADAVPAHALIGHYRAKAGPDVAAELIIADDGTFMFALAAGALDQTARGRWAADGTAIRLTTDPKPVPPQIDAAGVSRTDAAPLTVAVTWPNGRGIPGVDVKIGFDEGSTVDDYTQEDGWSMPADEKRVPRWIELAEPINGIVSARFPIDPASGNALRFVLTPNDLGVVDFEGATLTADGDDVVLRHGEASLPFERVVE